MEALSRIHPWYAFGSHTIEYKHLSTGGEDDEKIYAGATTKRMGWWQKGQKGQ